MLNKENESFMKLKCVQIDNSYQTVAGRFKEAKKV